ncbi:MAG TPA: hemerythrin domain-containing protein [Myxococcales bacterium]|nr:hemerythrin domain-containing protein [Myxococcales bacterium]
MQLLDHLRAEHEVIERAVGSLQAFAAAPGRSTEDGRAYLRFFRLYAGRFHHAREEESLFPALVRETAAPADRGPLKVLLEAHQAMAHLLDLMEPLLVQGSDIGTLASRYGKALLHHIDAENSVLFPEAETRLRRAGVPELADRPPDGEEAAAREALEVLLAKYPPQEIPDLIRGDGCVSCEAYGEGCDGVEREWWTELEWEDVFHRIG